MTSSRGPSFTTSSRVLAPWVAELNRALPPLRATLVPHLLVLRPSQHRGLGVFVRDGVTIRSDTRLAAYWGHLDLDPPLHSRFVLELPEASLGSSVVRPYVDARLACLRGNPPPDQAAMINHQCDDPSCRGTWYRDPASDLPIMVVTSRRSLCGGSELTYSYDGGLRSASFTMSRSEAALVPPSDPRPFPCRCAGLAVCPQDRFFP
jgi:hypothetical protein